MPRKRGTGKPYRFRIRKLKTGDYFYVMFRSQPGKWIATGCQDRESAETWAANYEITIKPDVQMTLAEFSEGFYDRGSAWLRRMEAKGRTFSERHLVKMRGNLRNYILPEFGNLILPAIRQRDIDDYLLDLKSIRDNSCPLKADAKNKVIITFRHIMQEAVSQGLIERDPTAGIVWFRDAVESERGIFTPEELKKLFPPILDEMVAIWGTLEWAAYFMIMGSCGLRPQEVGALTWSKWSRTLHGLAITHKIDPDTKQRVKGTKTGYSKAVALPRRAEELLLLHEATSKRTDPTDLIFQPREASGGIQSDTVNKHFKASCQRAGIERNERTPYSLRHSFNTYALQLLDRKEVQGLMGHRTDAMTIRYDHPSDQQLISRIPSTVWSKIERLWE